MNHALIFFIGLIIGLAVGVAIGLIVATLTIASSNADDLQEAYNSGIEKGKQIASIDNKTSSTTLNTN